MGNIDKIKSAIKGWRLGDYFRQFSIVAAGIIVTFWGSDRITEYSRQKEVRAAMQLVAEELEYNRKELRNIKHLLDIDRNMSSLLIKHKMDISGIPRDTLTKYDKLFNNMNELSYRTDALDVLKGSSLMQYISDKRLLQDVLQIYFELGKRKKDIGDYYAAKTDVLMGLAMSKNIKFALETNDSLLDQVSFLISNDEFVNFVIMVPGFLYWNEFDEMNESNTTNPGRNYEAYPAIPGSKIGDNKKTTYRILNSTVREMFQDYTDGNTPVTDLRRFAWFYDFENMEQEDEEITGGYAYPYKWRYARVATEGFMAGEFINFDQNKIWWRLADIYLLRAECRARLNDRTGAIADLNKIRDRAKAKRYNESEYDGNLRYAIFKEREKELLMEGSRYFDVLRNGYYKTELYGNFRNVSDQDVVDGVFFNALENTLFWDNPLMRQNTYWLKRQ